MSEAAACAYVHDVSGDRFDDVDGGAWACPHDALPDTDHCVFHQPVRALSERGVTAERVGAAIVDVV